MKFNTRKWQNRFDFLALSGWLILSLGLAVLSLIWFGMDFRGYYAAARVLMSGGNPYDYHQVANVLLQVTGRMGNNPYYYPPWFAWLFIPVAPLSFQVARAIWMAFNLILAIISLLSLSKMLNWPETGWRRYVLFIFVTLSFLWITWRYEQASILVFALLVATIHTIRSQQWFRAGVLLALLLIKPNISLIIVVAISLWLLRNGWRKPVFVMFLTLVVLTLISTLITPNWFQPIFDQPNWGQGLRVALDGPDKILDTRKNTTIMDWLAIFGIPETIRTFVYGFWGLIGAFTLLWAVLYSKSLLPLTSISLVIAYALTPYALQYDYPPLIIAFFWALSVSNKSALTKRIGLILAVFILSVSIWQQNIAWGYWMVVGLIFLVFWAIQQNNFATAE